jgi:hypothetical protein
MSQYQQNVSDAVSAKKVKGKSMSTNGPRNCVSGYSALTPS